MMKRGAIISAAAAFLCVSLAGWAWGGVEGSKHDFSAEPWADGDSCGVCHTPHQDDGEVAVPLWNPQADLTRTFGDAMRQIDPGWRVTTMCLRCHDGTVAKKAIVGVPRKREVHTDHPSMFAPAHQGADHPVGIRYPQLDRGFRPVLSVISKGTVVLPKGRVECISCHDPHDNSGVAKMLVTSNARSALCLTCHKK